MKQIEGPLDTFAFSSAHIKSWGRGQGAIPREGGGYSMHILRVFTMTELVEAKLLRVPAKFSRSCNYTFHKCILSKSVLRLH